MYTFEIQCSVCHLVIAGGTDGPWIFLFSILTNLCLNHLTHLQMSNYMRIVEEISALPPLQEHQSETGLFLNTLCFSRSFFYMVSEPLIASLDVNWYVYMNPFHSTQTFILFVSM